MISQVSDLSKQPAPLSEELLERAAGGESVRFRRKRVQYVLMTTERYAMLQQAERQAAYEAFLEDAQRKGDTATLTRELAKAQLSKQRRRSIARKSRGQGMWPQNQANPFTSA